MQLIKKTFIVLLSIGMTACSPGIVNTPSTYNSYQTQKSAYSLTVMGMTAKTIAENNQYVAAHEASPLPASFLQGSRGYHYRVAPGDVVGITVFAQPDLNAFQAVTEYQRDSLGYVVDDRGDIYYPYLGNVKVSGMTVEQIRSTLTSRLKRYIKDPILNIKVLQYRSQHADVIGEVNRAQPVAINDTPLTLVDAISFAGGPAEKGDLNNVILKRNQQNYRVNVAESPGSSKLNQLILKNGDVVDVKNYDQSQIYVLGEVLQPQAVVMTSYPMTLSRALASTGSLNPITSNAQVFVFRNYRNGQGVAYHLNLKSADAYLLANQFQLANQDVVYVSTYGLSKFNRIMRQVITSTASFNDLTDSALDIKLLTEND